MKKTTMKVSMMIEGEAVRPTSTNVFPTNNRDALEHTIQKYEWLKRWAMKNIGAKFPHLGGDSCALCEINYGGAGKPCEGCPVSRITYETNCQGTPFIQLRDCYEKPVTQSTLHLIDCEIAFLKSLRRD